jgi:hypothetical protein
MTVFMLFQIMLKNSKLEYCHVYPGNAIVNYVFRIWQLDLLDNFTRRNYEFVITLSRLLYLENTTSIFDETCLLLVA